MLITAVERQKHITYIHSSAHIPSTYYTHHMYRHTTHTSNIQAYAIHTHAPNIQTYVTHTFYSKHIPHTCIHNIHIYTHYCLLPYTHKHIIHIPHKHLTYTNSTHIHIHIHTDILHTHIPYM